MLKDTRNVVAEIAEGTTNPLNMAAYLALRPIQQTAIDIISVRPNFIDSDPALDYKAVERLTDYSARITVVTLETLLSIDYCIGIKMHRVTKATIFTIVDPSGREDELGEAHLAHLLTMNGITLP